MRVDSVQLLLSILLATECILLARLYYCRLVRPHRLRANQYRFFAIRDMAIRAAIEAPELKENELWQELYATTNRAAKEQNVLGLMNAGFQPFADALDKNGLRLEKAEASAISFRQSDSKVEMPDALMIQYIVTVLDICWNSSRWWRTKYLLSGRIERFTRFFAKTATDGYSSWRNALISIAKPASLLQSKTISSDFNKVITRESARQDNRAPCV